MSSENEKETGSNIRASSLPKFTKLTPYSTPLLFSNLAGSILDLVSPNFNPLTRRRKIAISRQTAGLALENFINETVNGEKLWHSGIRQTCPTSAPFAVYRSFKRGELETGRGLLKVLLIFFRINGTRRFSVASVPGIKCHTIRRDLN